MYNKFGDPRKKQIYNCITPGCQNKIIFGERDEAYYREKGWVNPDGSITKPKRCLKCRRELKEEYAKHRQKRAY